jgi:peptidase E
VYGKKLECKTTLLDMVRNTPSVEELKEKIFSSDLIYIAGGNTLDLMTRLRKFGVDLLLQEAYQKGIILS